MNALQIYFDEWLCDHEEPMLVIFSSWSRSFLFIFKGFSIKETPCHALYTFYNILLMSDPEGNS